MDDDERIVRALLLARTFIDGLLDLWGVEVTDDPSDGCPRIDCGYDDDERTCGKANCRYLREADG